MYCTSILVSTDRSTAGEIYFTVRDRTRLLVPPAPAKRVHMVGGRREPLPGTERHCSPASVGFRQRAVRVHCCRGVGKLADPTRFRISKFIPNDASLFARVCESIFKISESTPHQRITFGIINILQCNVITQEYLIFFYRVYHMIYVLWHLVRP